MHFTVYPFLSLHPPPSLPPSSLSLSLPPLSLPPLCLSPFLLSLSLPPLSLSLFLSIPLSLPPSLPPSLTLSFSSSLSPLLLPPLSLSLSSVNPIIELFTGECVTEGVINDQPFVNDSKFGAFPVQVEGNADLHDSLEAATVSREMQQEVGMKTYCVTHSLLKIWRFLFWHLIPKMHF